LARGAVAASLLASLGLVGASATILSTPPALAAGPTITGAGSSYAAVAIENWVAQVSTVYGDAIDYSVSSSVIGLNLFAQKQVTFGASEIGYSTGQANYNPSSPYQYLPDVAGATCLMYNVKGRLGNQLQTLNLNSQVLAKIWTGTVTNWDDPAIAALNKGVDLPNAPIVAVFRTDASGENYLFSQYLDYLQPGIWQPFVQTLQSGDPVSANFPQGTNHGHYNLSNFVGQNGSDGASNFVASVNDSVTYVETAYALLHHMPCAYVQNASGNWVAPSEETDAVGLEKAQLLPDLEQKLQGVYSNPLPSAYPISAYSYLITPKGPGSIPPAEGAVLGQFIRFLACTGQNSAGTLGYSPLPPNLVDADFAAINRIPGAAPAPAVATAANCSDPYVDGQTVLPGEPCIAGLPCPNNNGGGSTTTTTTTVPGSSTTGTTGPSGPGQSKTGSKGKGSGKKKSGGSQHYGGGPTGPGVKSGNTSIANGQWPGQKIVPGAAPGSNLDGQTLGNELASEDFTLLGVRVSPATMWGSVALLILLLALPPTVARSRRRRRLEHLATSAPEGDPS
jgi:phosphate transport system substrate-binding protein